MTTNDWCGTECLLVGVCEERIRIGNPAGGKQESTQPSELGERQRAGELLEFREAKKEFFAMKFAIKSMAGP